MRIKMLIFTSIILLSIFIFILNLPILSCKIEIRAHLTDGNELSSFEEVQSSLYEMLSAQYTNCSVDFFSLFNPPHLNPRP